MGEIPVSNHNRRLVIVWVAIVVVLLYTGANTLAVWLIQDTIVGKTPEGFHRTDAVELMEALCLMNAELRCPNPYDLPNYYEIRRLQGD